MPSAIVTGATGLTGSAIVKALGQDTAAWEKVFALSRSQKEKYPANVHHDTLDLQANAKSMASQLQGVEAEYVFFCAYLAKDDEQEAANVNGAMLRNFLEALTITGAEKKLKRIILTAGLKQYGVHLGQPKNPMTEEDPWLEGSDRPPNFYYDQQRILQDLSKNKSWDWVVTYPQDVIGMAKGNFMNLSTSLGLYAAVSKALPGSQLIFPGSQAFYTMFNVWTSARLHARFCLWAALEPKAGNEGFNVVNGDIDSWQNLWPRFAKRFGCTIPAKQFDAPTVVSGSKVTLGRPPIDDYARAMGLEGAFQPSVIEQHIDLLKWSKDPKVKETWDKLAKDHRLEFDTFEKATWGFLGFVLGRNYSMVCNMTKARRLGWDGWADTWEEMTAAWEGLENVKVLPPTK
ncbi:MAG: hypothetical protein Q9160_001241 [Pyrenula sp. 1 TL-2023]